MSKTKKPVGRPSKPIDKDQFEKLCALHGTQEEMCGFFDVSDTTLESWCQATYGVNFLEISKLKQGPGKLSLRRTQYSTAMKGNVPMLIWLGKNWLKQRDRTKEEIEDENASREKDQRSLQILIEHAKLLAEKL